MAKGISIAIASETRDFARGVKADMIDPLEDVAQVLDEVARSGDDAGRQLEDSLRDSQRSTDELSDEMRTLKDRIDDAKRKSKDFGDAGRRAGSDVSEGFDRARKGVDDFKGEAEQTARETAASFGSVEDAIDGVQELAAQGLGSFGPVGAAAGLAVAGGIGLAVTAFEELSEAEQESRERVAEWADAYIEANGRVLSASQTLAMQRSIYGDADRYKEAEENARNWGVTVETAVAAMSGETWALASANEALTQREQEAFEASIRLADGGEALADVLGGQTAETRNGRQALEQLSGEMERGRQAAEEYSRGLLLTAENAVGATREVDEFGDTIVTLPDGKQIYIDAETGQATDNVDAIEQRLYGIPDATANVRVNVDDSQLGQYLRQNLNRTAIVNIQTRRGLAVEQ